MPESESKTSTVPFVRATLGIFRRDPNDFLSDAISDHGRNLVTSLWPGDKATINGVRHNGSPRPKKFRVQKSAVKIFASIFWDQDGIFLTYYLPKGQTINSEYYSSLLVQLKDIFKEKRRGAGRSPNGSCSCMIMPRLTGHLQPRRNWPTWASSVLITHPILQIWPRRTTICSLDWKNNLNVAIFLRRGGHCCRGDLVGRTTFWVFFFWLTCKG